ncbi:MAG: bleomycin hydrolase [Planctomycetota bacterium]|jgi:bleomycin hydrolase
MIQRLTLITALLAVVASPLLAQGDGFPKTEDGKFTIVKEIKRLPVLNQDQTGTCWSFATVSYLESELERINGKPTNLSEMYPVYFTYMEKGKRFIEKKGESQFSEGGLSHDIMLVAKKYGLAPQSAYDGLCLEDTKHNHGEMSRVLKAMAGIYAKAKPRRGAPAAISPKWEAAFQGVLNAYIGELPKTFKVGDRMVTPKQYADEILKVPYDDYVEVMSFGYSDFGKRATLTIPDNWYHDDNYLNVDVKKMMAGIDHAVTNGYSIAADMDVSERGFKPRKGMASMPPELEKAGVDDAWRLEMFKNGKTSDDHLMHIVGMAKDKAGKTWYLTKNSWGTQVGPYKGYLFMSRNYVAAKMLSYMVHKDGLTDALKKSFKL